MEMIDVITKLREIADNSPEIKQALDNTTRLSAQRVEEGVQITVSGSDAVLHQILKLAGMIGAECCLLYTSPSPRDYAASRMPSSA